MSEQKLENKIGIVTGASRGIGSAVARELAKHGAAVVLNYNKSKDRALQVADAIKAYNKKISIFKADVGKKEEAKALVDFTVRQYGTVDILVNNAGIIIDKLILDMEAEDWQRVIDTNLTGIYFTTREVLPYMMEQRSGAIVNMSSIAAITGGKGHCNYVAAKGGIISFTKAISDEVAYKGIRVNAIAAGYIETDMTEEIRAQGDKKFLRTIPLRRFGQPGEVAKVVLFLVSNDSSYITGKVIEVSGGI
jgi:3-oxoacyl-[acyl-carrier protein] reductase